MKSEKENIRGDPGTEKEFEFRHLPGIVILYK